MRGKPIGDYGDTTPRDFFNVFGADEWRWRGGGARVVVRGGGVAGDQGSSTT